MQPKTNAVASRLAGALIGTVLLVAALAAPQRSAAASNDAVATRAAVGLLAPGAGYDKPQGSTRVRALQVRLDAAGEATGPVDGRFGPLTEAAVRHFQIREGLVADGLVGPRTQTALRRDAALLRLGTGYGLGRGSRRVRELQRDLRASGEHLGRIDGRFGPVTENAVRHFQSREGLAADGVAGRATRLTLARRLASVQGPRSQGHVAQAKDSPKAGRRTEQPNRTAYTERPRAVPVGSRSVGDSGGSSRMAIAVTLIAALAFVFGMVALTLRRRSREQVVPLGDSSDGNDHALYRPGRGLNGAGDLPGAPGTTVLGYACVAAPPGAAFNGEFVDQSEKIASECERRGLALLELVREREPEHASGIRRPGLSYALDRIWAGEAQGLVVADLSRLSLSVTDLGKVLSWFSRANARLVAAKEGIDTADRGGRLAARILIEVSGWERERLGKRTRKGMTAARRKGPPVVADNPKLKRRIELMRAEGLTLQAIADRLNEEGVPTVRGGARWRPSSVQSAAGYKRPRSDDSRGARPGGGTVTRANGGG
jgi:peptidoglycan hydrolase-like protein with peptidoglycan-binding domain/DNA invertase Pin-like site-specific DNA recombinase